MANKVSYEFTKGIWKENPVMVSLLGLCPTLAITNNAMNGLSMGLATGTVLIASNFMVSSVRKLVSPQVRIAVYILLIATSVSIVDRFMLAYFPVIHKALGPYIPLIIVNCIILGRAEAFASKNSPFISVIDAAGNGIGIILILLGMGIIREFTGSGTIFDISITDEMIKPVMIMVLPPGAFLTLGGIIYLTNWIADSRKKI